MIWQLVKREAVWRQLYGFAAVVALLCLAMPRRAGGIFAFVVVLSWLQQRPAERASAFHAGLPIQASDLFLSRFLAFMALGWVPAAAGAAVLLATGNSVVPLAETAAGFPVLVLACLAHRVRQLAGSQWTQAIAFGVVTAVAWPVSTYVQPDVVLPICLIVSALLFAYIWMQLPQGFEVAGPPPAEDGWAASAGHARPLAPQRPTVRRPLFGPWNAILRATLPPSALGFLPVIVLVYMSGQWFYAASQCIFPMMSAVTRLGWTRGLPLSRNTILTLLVGPWMLALAVNLGLGAYLFNSRTPIQFDYVADKLGAVRPPLAYWRLAPGGKTPSIQAPWGETWQPPVKTAGGIAIYNPYGMGETNSRRFLEWQYGRATLAIYGQALEFNDYHPPAGVQPLTRQARFVVLNSALGLCWLLWLVNMLLLAMHWRLQRLFHGAYNVVVGLLLTPMAIALALEILVKGPSGSVGEGLLHAGLNAILALLPGGVSPVLLAAAVPFGLLWWSALRLFDGMEPPPVDPTVRA